MEHGRTLQLSASAPAFPVSIQAGDGAYRNLPLLPRLTLLQPRGPITVSSGSRSSSLGRVPQRSITPPSSMQTTIKQPLVTTIRTPLMATASLAATMPVRALHEVQSNLSRRCVTAPKLLNGLSSSAELFNSHTDRTFHMLVSRDDNVGGPVRPVHQQLSNIGLLTEDVEFASQTVKLMDKIAEMRKFHDTFEPTKGPASPKARQLNSPKGSNGNARRSSASAEEMELAERLEAYKMVRKLEPELPPLSPLTTPANDVFKVRNEGIIKWHVSPDFIHNCTRQARREFFENRKEQKMQRFVSAANFREERLLQQHAELTEVLQRKKEQAKNATMNRKEPGIKKRGFDEFFLERWMTMSAVTKFMRKLANTLELSKQPAPSLRMIVLPKTDSNMTAKMKILICMCWRYVRVKEHRKKVRVVYNSLKQWKVAGRCVIMLQRFARNIVNLQRWWRTTAKRLKETRDKISRRWERLERAELHRELHRESNKKTEQVHEKGLVRRPTVQTPKLSVEEKVELERIDEATRLRFLEHELRARRYLLLPQLHLYEGEVKQWRQDCADIKETRKAHQALGLEEPRGLIFRWPPVRPSHVPGAHLQTEARGASCPDWCVGRKGDEDILRMWRRCRKNPRGWTDIPQRMSGRHTYNSKKCGNVTKEKPTESVRLFGDATDEDLTRWGIDPDRMPGMRPADIDGDGEYGGVRGALAKG